MRYADDLSNEELVALTDDQRTVLIDLECARNGVPILISEAPVSPEQQTFNQDFSYFEMSGFLCDAETMKKVMAAVEDVVFYDKCYSTGVIKVTDNSYNKLRAEPCKGYSEQRYNEIKVKKEIYDAQMTVYKERLTEHNTAVEDRKVSVDSVNNLINDAANEQYKIDIAKTEWAKYLKLSNENQAIAMNFMQSRYDIEFIKQVVPSYFAIPIEDDEVAAPQEEN